MPLNINSIGCGGSNTNHSSTSEQLTLSSVNITEKYYDKENIIGIQKNSISTESDKNTRLGKVYIPSFSEAKADLTSDWVNNSTLLYVEEESSGIYLTVFFDDGGYYSSNKPNIRIVRINTNQSKGVYHVSTLIKEYVNTDYGAGLFSLYFGTTRSIKHNDLIYTCKVAESTWDIWLVSLDPSTGTSTDLVKMTSIIGTGNNYSIYGMSMQDDTSDIIWICYYDGSNYKLVKYNISENKMYGPYTAPSYTSSGFQCKYATPESFRRTYSDSAAYTDWTLPNISPTYVFGYNTKIIGNKAIIIGTSQESYTISNSTYTAYSYSFALFSFTESSSSLTLTLEKDNLTSIYNGRNGKYSTDISFNLSSPYIGTIYDNNCIFGLNGISRGGWGSSGNSFSTICQYEFMYLPDDNTYGIREIYSVPQETYMSYCYSDASIGNYDPVVLWSSSDTDSSTIDFSLDCYKPTFNIAFLGSNNHIDYAYKKTPVGSTLSFVKVKMVSENISNSSDSRRGEYSYSASKGDVIYASDQITYVKYDNGDKINVGLRRYVVTKDSNILICVEHDTFRYRPTVIVRDKSGPFLNLVIERDGSKISGKFIKNMKINDHIITDNGTQEITDSSFNNERIYINMEDI